MKTWQKISPGKYLWMLDSGTWSGFISPGRDSILQGLVGLYLKLILMFLSVGTRRLDLAVRRMLGINCWHRVSRCLFPRYRHCFFSGKRSSRPVGLLPPRSKMVNTSFDPKQQREDDDSLRQWYTDYVVAMKGSKLEGTRDMLIVVHTNAEFLDGHGPFRGYEILKLSNPDNSLAGPNPRGLVNKSSRQTLRILCRVFSQKNAIASGVVAVLVVVNVIVNLFWVFQESRHIEIEMMIEEEMTIKEENMPSVKAGRLCRQFSLAELRSVTQNFSEMNRIGRGGFGKVYRGVIDNGEKTVAVKRLKSSSRQGAREFLTEIETLTELRHVNLVSLIGYCNQGKEMILVYEYMASGTLGDHLFPIDLTNDNTPPLTWKQLLNICIGAGRGLDYLHTGQSIIHRDVKASNILLDEDFTAKVGDFGLAKPLSPTNLQKSHVSTKVRGTFGYWDPEYLATGKLTMKSDVYSFGVVLLEVLSGRRASDLRVSLDEQNLTRWAKENISKGKFDHLVGLKLRGQISEDSLKAFVDVVERCLHDEPKRRPTMAEVVLQLQYALEPPESSKRITLNEKSNLDDNHLSNDEAESSTSIVQFKNPSEDDHILLSPMKEQVDTNVANFQPATSIKDKRKSRLPKLSRLWPRGAFRKKSEPSANNETLMPDLHVKALVEKDKIAINSTPIGISSSPPNELHGEFISSDLDSELPSIPAVPCDELKYVNFVPKWYLEDEEPYHAVHVILKSGQDATLKLLKYNKQTDQDFLAQVSKWSSLNHRNLARLLGYSMGGRQRILAYEHAARGSLYDILHDHEGVPGRKPIPVLSWNQRVKIAIEGAKGLEYLHEMKHVHGHVKSSNILVFDHGDTVAKITDFHLPSKFRGPGTGKFFFHPNPINGNGYFLLLELPTAKRDVYSFGVVLLELLTGRKPFDPKLPYREKFLVHRARPYLSDDKVNQCVDGRLDPTYPPMVAAKIAALASRCLEVEPDFRPTMDMIIGALESLLNVASTTGAVVKAMD